MSKKIIGYCKDSEREMLNDYAKANGYDVIRIFRISEIEADDKKTQEEMFNFLNDYKEIDRYLVINLMGQINEMILKRNERGKLAGVEIKDAFITMPKWTPNFIYKIINLWQNKKG